MTETIVAAAIEWNGLIFHVPAPGRHHHVAHAMYRAGLPTDAQRHQGFVTSTGRYVGRVEARAIATAAGQLLPTECRLRELYSEDVW